MFTDIKTSRDMMQDFHAKMQQQRQDDGGPSESAGPSSAPSDPGVELQVQVLTTGSWPTQAVCVSVLPRELEQCCQDFADFYLKAYSGRRLVWQTNMGTADLRVDFGSKRHEINVSTYQMCILMLYNNADRLSYREIAESTGIPAVDLQRCLQSLALIKGKNVLRKEPLSKDINETDVFHFNDKFQVCIPDGLFSV